MASLRFNLRCWTVRTRERFWFKLAWLLPTSLVYFASIRMIAHATGGKNSNVCVPDLRAMDALESWPKP